MSTAGFEAIDGAPAASAAGATLDRDGTLVLRGAFAPTWVARVAWLAGDTAGASTAAIDGPLAEPTLLAHPRLAPLLTAVLGDGYNVGRLALGAGVADALANLPAATSLFGDDALHARMPAVGVALLAPLVSARIPLAPGAHRASAPAPGVAIDLAPGDALLFDARLPVAPPPVAALLVVHYRHWFRAPAAPLDAPPVSISRLTYRRLPAAQRALFTWRVDRYLRLRPRLLLDRGVRRLPVPLGDAVRALLARRGAHR